MSNSFATMSLSRPGTLAAKQMNLTKDGVKDLSKSRKRKYADLVDYHPSIAP